jgi:tetratricopeptide (TPR) repeat protein
MIVWSLLSICVALAPARAAEPAQDRSLARTKLDQANALALEEAYDAALAAIAEGLAVDPRNIALLQLRANLLLAKRDFAGARTAYEALLPTPLSAANRRKVRDVIRILQATRSTFVEIALNVPADVYVDAKALGKACDAAAQCKLALLPGKYRILIERPNFKAVRQVIRVRRDQTITITQELEELPSTFAVKVTPSDAVVTLNDQVWLAEQSELPAGDYVVRAWRPDFFAHDARISAHQGEPIALDVTLDERQPVAVSPPRARLTLDGRPVKLEGRAVRLSGDRQRLVAEGALRLPAERQAHTLVAEAEGYEPITVTLPADRALGDALDIALAPVPPVPRPPPPDGTDEWTVAKIATTASAGTAALVGFGAATMYVVQAQRQMDRVDKHCTSEGGAGLSCDDEGKAAAAAAQGAAMRANQAFAAGTTLAIGALYALNANEPASKDGGMSLRRKLSIGGSMGVAAAGLAVGALHGWRARALHAQARSGCSTDVLCNDSGFILTRQAQIASHTANLGFTVAGVAATGAALLWWRAPESGASESRLRIEPVIQPGELSISLSGGF